MKAATMVARYLLGVGMLVFGVNTWLKFMSPPPLPEDGAQFMGLLFGSGYFNAVAILMIVSGLAFVTGRYVALGLTLIGPVLVNILIFHFAFDLAGIVMGLVFSVLWFVVFWKHKGSFAAIFSADG